MSEYRIPTIAETNKLEKKFNVISTFSGGGGSCLGYKMAGGGILVANEFIPQAQATYRENFPETNLLTGDIRELTGKDFLDAAGLKEGELDIFDGSPPCASFSTSGKREKGWGKVKSYSDTNQRADDLFFEYARILGEIQPKTFIAENVKGLTMGAAKGYLKEIYSELVRTGYSVHSRLLNSYNYGVPQARERLIFVGVRKDLEDTFEYPRHAEKKYTLRDAISNIKHHSLKKVTPCCMRELEIMNYEGCKSERYFNLQRAWFHKPCPTLVAQGFSAAQIAHPTENRFFSIEERKAITSLPIDYMLTGSLDQQAERIGRMVPPLMMKAVADAVYTTVLKRVNNV